MTALAIVRRDLVRYLRNPGRTALLFAMPLVLAGVFALVFGGDGPQGITIKVLLFDEDDSLLSRVLAGASDSTEANERLDIVPVGAEGFEMIENGEASALIHIPPGFTADYLKGRETTIEVIKNPAQRFLPKIVDEGTGILGVGLSQASIVFRPELDLLASLSESETFPEDALIASMSGAINGKMRELDRLLFPPVISLETSTRETAPESDQPSFSVISIMLPGLTVMGILFLAQSATRDILRDRESGLLRHLLTSPASIGDYVAGKSLSVLLATSLGFIILVLIGVAAGVDWGVPLAVGALIFGTSLAASGTLMLIMSLVGSERQGDALTTIVIISWSMVGGAFVPVSQIPAFLRPVSASSPVYWATDGFMQLITAGAGLTDIALNLGILAGFGFFTLLGGAVLLHRRIRGGLV